MKNIFNILVKIISYIIFAILVLIILGILFYVARINYLASQDRLGEIKTNFYTILTQSMYPNIKAGDIVITFKDDNNKYNEQDVITFISEANGNILITHRVMEVYKETKQEKLGMDEISVEKYSYKTKGDNNNNPDAEIVPDTNVLGKVVFKLPKAGYIQQFLVSRTGWIVAILLPSLGIIIYDILKIFKRVTKKNKLVDEESEEVKQRKDELNKLLSENDVNIQTSETNVSQSLSDSTEIQNENASSPQVYSMFTDDVSTNEIDNSETKKEVRSEVTTSSARYGESSDENSVNEQNTIENNSSIQDDEEIELL